MADKDEDQTEIIEDIAHSLGEMVPALGNIAESLEELVSVQKDILREISALRNDLFQRGLR